MSLSSSPCKAQQNQLLEEADAFVRLYFHENRLGSPNARLAEVVREIGTTGTYVQTTEELVFGARVAWRNSNRCIGRLYWKSLKVIDLRRATSASQVVEAVVNHLNWATNQGDIRSVITVFPPEDAEGKAPLRFWNPQLIRYAGYLRPDGSILGDPAQLELTRRCMALGWKGAGTHFDLLPVVFEWQNGPPQWFELPPEAVLEVPIVHPEYPKLSEMGLKWHAVPVISDMGLDVGGIYYPAAPFNGWYLVTEVAARNFLDTDRYNLLPQIAQSLGLDPTEKLGFWKDRALLELNRAVYLSYQAAGIKMVDPHTASEQFLHFIRTEEKNNRNVTADWSWIVPPLGGSTLGVFHRSWENDVLKPNFFYQTPVWSNRPGATQGCPFSRNK